MKITNCRFCHAVLSNPGTITIHGTKLFKYTCPTCGLIQTPQSKVDYTSGDLVSYYEDRKNWISHRHKYIFDTIENILNKKKLKFLDIGCGIGFSLKEAGERGWSAVGVEPNKDLAQYAKDRLQVEISNSYFSSSTISNEQFDFILIDNVIEHLDQPFEMIREASLLLKPSGIILIAVPPVDFARKILSKSAYIREKVDSATINMFNDTYEHINFIPRKAMKKLAKNLNLKLLDVNFHHHKRFEVIQKALVLESGYFFMQNAAHTTISQPKFNA